MSAFYDDVLRFLNAAPLNQHFDKSWTSHVQVKATLYDVESQLQQAAQLHKDDDIAPEIARLKVSIFTCVASLHFGRTNTSSSLCVRCMRNNVCVALCTSIHQGYVYAMCERMS